MFSFQQLTELIKKELEEGLYDATSRSDFSMGRPRKRKRTSLHDLETHKQEMKAVGHLERALETLELIGDDRDETYGVIKKVRDLIYKQTGLDIKEDDGGWYDPHVWPDDLKWSGGSKVIKKQKLRKKMNKDKGQNKDEDN